jgi:hypothetical protein
VLCGSLNFWRTARSGSEKIQNEKTTVFSSLKRIQYQRTTSSSFVRNLKEPFSWKRRQNARRTPWNRCTLLHLPSKTILLSLLISNERLSREDLQPIVTYKTKCSILLSSVAEPVHKLQFCQWSVSHWVAHHYTIAILLLAFLFMETSFPFKNWEQICSQRPDYCTSQVLHLEFMSQQNKGLSFLSPPCLKLSNLM